MVVKINTDYVRNDKRNQSEPVCRILSRNPIATVRSNPILFMVFVFFFLLLITSLLLEYFADNDKILNVDAKEDWLALLKYMNTLDLCVENASEIIENPTNIETSSLAINTRILAPPLTTDLNVQGIIPLKGCTSNKCRVKGKPPDYIEVEFTLTKNDGNATQLEDVCVKLIGPANFMPKFEELQLRGLCDPIKPHPETWKKLIVKSNSEEKQGNFCSSGLGMTFNYDINYDRECMFDIYSSDEERLLISWHMIVTSCFLFCIALVLACYALIKKRNPSITAQNNF